MNSFSTSRLDPPSTALQVGEPGATGWPAEQAGRSNPRWRPVGLGVMGLQDVFFKLRLPFDSERARELSTRVAEEVYLTALESSADLAASAGAHPAYAQTRAARGDLQPDLWGVTPAQTGRWAAVRERIAEHGLRNSLLIAVAPTATIARPSPAPPSALLLAVLRLARHQHQLSPSFLRVVVRLGFGFSSASASAFGFAARVRFGFSSVASASSFGFAGARLRFGFSSAFAGGVEATSSMGGQIMPPVMGAVAFIMAETIDVPYAKIVEAAPGIKTATVSNVLKPAKTETGLVVGVPNFINEGDVITVDTETGEYVGRAKSA